MRHVDGRGWVGVRVMMLVQVVGRVGTDAATSGVICVICVISFITMAGGYYLFIG